MRLDDDVFLSGSGDGLACGEVVSDTSKVPTVGPWNRLPAQPVQSVSQCQVLCRNLL